MSPRISRREKVKRLTDLFDSSDRVLLPINADPDAISAALAVKRLLWRKVAGVTIARVNEIKRPDNLTLIRLLRIKMIPFEEIKVADFDRFVLVDGQPEHHRDLAGIKYDAVIDHHPILDSTEAEFVDIRPTFGATATIMTEYLQAAKITPSKTLATALFYAIKTDTDTFSRPTVADDMRAFRYLYQYADHNHIRKIESSEIPLALLRHLRTALEVLNIRGDTGFTYLGRVTNPDHLVQVADFLMHIQTLDTVAVGGVFDDHLVVIFRNARPRRSVGRMAEKAFGRLGRAGGHSAAARAEVPLAELEKIGQSLEDEDLSRFMMQAIRDNKSIPLPQVAPPEPPNGV